MTELAPTLYTLAAVLLFCLGFFALLTKTRALRRIMALNVMGVGVFLTFIAQAARGSSPVADPVPHAMVLTGIVVSVCATGLASTLARRLDEAEAGQRDHGRPGDGADDRSDGAVDPSGDEVPR